VLFGDLVNGGKVSITIDDDKLIFAVNPNELKAAEPIVENEQPEAELIDERTDN
jgi:hypothetical protein